MANLKPTEQNTVLVAIDISKHRHEVLIAIPGKKRNRRFTLTNSLEDFDRLIAFLKNLDASVRVGFEATGNYHRALVFALGKAGFELKLVSSVAMARTREALWPAPSKWSNPNVRIGFGFERRHAALPV